MAIVVVVIFLCAGFLFWRYVWFFRNPVREIPVGESVVSPADGTVVYIREIEPGENVIVIKRGVAAQIQDILKEDIDAPKILLGIFMSPFDVHYNRAPVAGVVEMIRHVPARSRNVHMGPMHLRTLLGKQPFYENSLHIIENERTVTRIRCHLRENEFSCYVIQIAGRSVNGIDCYCPVGNCLEKGQVFGMIRIGSQVDLVIPKLENLGVTVKPGDKVRAGESVLLDWETPGQEKPDEHHGG